MFMTVIVKSRQILELLLDPACMAVFEVGVLFLCRSFYRQLSKTHQKYASQALRQE